MSRPYPRQFFIDLIVSEIWLHSRPSYLDRFANELSNRVQNAEDSAQTIILGAQGFDLSPEFLDITRKSRPNLRYQPGNEVI